MPWTRAQELQLADEIEEAIKAGKFKMMRRAVTDYARMRKEVEACSKR